MAAQIEMRVDPSKLEVKIIYWSNATLCKVLNTADMVMTETNGHRKSALSVILKFEGSYGTAQKTYKFVYDFDECKVTINGEKCLNTTHFLNNDEKLIGYDIKKSYKVRL